MLATLADPPIQQRGLVYEPKYDGIRALIDVESAAAGQPRVAIYSRNGNEKTLQFPEIAAALSAVVRPADLPLLLDGEIVAVDDRGTPLGFQHIQGRIHLTNAADIVRAQRQQPTTVVLFDLLRDGAEDIRMLTMVERRLRLQRRIRPTPPQRPLVRLSEIALDDGRLLLARARAEQWEGLIVKDAESTYQSGRRSPAWRKLKLLNEQEFVVGGWTEPRQTRPHFGALLLGYFDDERKLRWAGSVGTGFDDGELNRVAGRLKKLKIDRSPFADAFKTAEPAHWVRPELVAQVRFTEWTSDGLLRHPVYLGMRDDKKATTVRREKQGTAPKPVLPAPPSRKRNRRDTSAAPAVAARARAGDAASASKALSSLADHLSALEHDKKDGELQLPNGDTLRVTNLAKVFWPKLRLTKGDLLRYYVQVSPYLLPAVDDRPLVMKRFPNGVGKQAFYQQRHPEAVPPGVRREILPEDVEPITEEGPRNRLIGGSLTTLLYMTQIAAISQDPWFSRVADPLHADFAAIDLDPGDDATFAKVLDVARWVKDELDRLEIPAVPKTSGASGLHIYVPLPKGATYDTGQVLCQIVATIVATKHPRVATVERWVKKRPKGTVYVDYLQNILGKTLATAYSARASEYAGVSTPLTWKEILEGVDPRDFTIKTAPQRFRESGDLWARLRSGKPVDLQRVISKTRA